MQKAFVRWISLEETSTLTCIKTVSETKEAGYEF